MNKKIIRGFAVVGIVAIAVFVCAAPRAPVAHAQSVTSTVSAAVEVSQLASVVSALGNIEAQRIAIVNTIQLNVASIADQVQALPNAPMATDAQRAAVAAQITAISQSLSQLSQIAATLDQIRSQEISILGAVSSRLMILQGQV